MFKSALKDLTSAVVGSVGGTIQQYNPEKSGIGHGSAIGRVMEQGVANISYRSPILADLAHTIVQSFQHEHQKTQDINGFLKSDSPLAKEFREETKGKLGDKAKPKDVDKEMKKILSDLAKKLERGDEKEVKQSDEYKKYGKFLEEAFPSLKEPEKKEPTVAPVGGAAPAQTSSQGIGDVSGLIEQLVKIEHNTNRTVNALEEIANLGGLTGGGGGGHSKEGGQVSGHGNSGVYIDPYTGLPSVKGTMGAIGAKILTNVIDDKAIDAISDKIRGLFTKKKKDGEPEATDEKTPEEEKEAEEKTVSSNSESILGQIKRQIEEKNAPAVTDDFGNRVSTKDKNGNTVAKRAAVDDFGNVIEKPATGTPTEAPKRPVESSIKRDKGATLSKSINDVLGDLNLDLGVPVAGTQASPETAKEVAAEHKKTEDQQTSVATQTLEEIKKLNSEKDKKKVEPEKKGGIVETLKDGAEKILDIGKLLGGKGLGGLSKIGRGIGTLAKGAGGIGKSAIGGALEFAGNAASYIPKGAAIASGLSSLATAGTALAGTSMTGLAAGGLGTMAAGAVGVAGAGYGAYKLGSEAINPLIDKGISSATGGKSLSLGDWMYSKMNPNEPKFDEPVKTKYDGMTREQIEVANKKKSEVPEGKLTPQQIEAAAKNSEVPESKQTPQQIEAAVKKAELPEIEPVKKMTVRELDNAQAQKEKLDAKKEAESSNQQQILINNTAAPAKSAPTQSSPVIMGNLSVRNLESSFDKVQMQNFWSRAY